MFKKRKVIVQKKIVKKKKMHIKSVKFNFIKSIHLRKIVARVVFFRSMYVIVCLMISVSIKNVKIKILFNSDAEINYMSKKFTNSIQLFIHQEINIVIMNFTDERARFFNVCELTFINIENIIILIFIFVIKQFNHELFLDRFFQRIARINVVNMNNDSLKIMLHSLNDEKRMNFLRIFTEYVKNKNKKFVFVFKTLNV